MATAKTGQQAVTETLPSRPVPPPAPPTGRKTVPAAPSFTQPHEVLRAFIAYRRAQLKAALGPPGVSRGGSVAIQAAQAMAFLIELDAFAQWLEDGQPRVEAILTEKDRLFWKDAQERGVPVPPDIASQL